MVDVLNHIDDVLLLPVDSAVVEPTLCFLVTKELGRLHLLNQLLFIKTLLSNFKFRKFILQIFLLKQTKFLVENGFVAFFELTLL